ncbi:MAG: hypothetical protein ACE5JH_11145 [Acidobacteriota bacterium]
MSNRAEARAPTRIDLAGGTIDLWPLSLLHEDPLTVNAAIDLYACASVERVATPGVEVVSRDRGASLRVDSPGRLRLGVNDAGADLEFVVRLAAHFMRPDRLSRSATRLRGYRIATDCRAPAGSGLGGSSALGIALASCLDRFVGTRMEGEALLSLTRAIETQVLRIPTGEQDYHPALRGGVLALGYTVEGTRVERLPVDLAQLRDRTVLAYTGRSRSSGISNWDVLKRHLDGETGVRDALDRVNRAAHAMRQALRGGDWDAAGEALAEEWAARKGLSSAVTSESIDRLIEAARSAGALGGKVCGAGGGGCLVMWARAGRRSEVESRLERLGARVLDFRYVEEGVAVSES